MWTCSKTAGCDNLLFLDRLCSCFMSPAFMRPAPARQGSRVWRKLKSDPSLKKITVIRNLFTGTVYVLKFQYVRNVSSRSAPHPLSRSSCRDADVQHPGAAVVLTICFANWVCFSRLCNRRRRNAVTMHSKHVSPCSSLFGSLGFVCKVIPQCSGVLFGTKRTHTHTHKRTNNLGSTQAAAYSTPLILSVMLRQRQDLGRK